MPAQREWDRLDPHETIGIEELCSACRISVDELREIVAYGVLAPVHAGDPQVFTADWLPPLREAARLRRAFDLELFAAGLVAEHLHRIEELEREIRALRRQLGA
jgi:chaperone modulatory protein CbpM